MKGSKSALGDGGPIGPAGTDLPQPVLQDRVRCRRSAPMISAVWTVRATLLA
jgi:hypothetical protein